MVDIFKNNLQGYVDWTEQHPGGYVLNIRPGTLPPMMHRTPCMHIFPAKAEYGDFTKKPKICSDTRGEIESWARKNGKAIVLCSTCDV